ncbi:MAG: (deoxy)nucleoside triphosphate pyrophosphohydrolase [Nitrospira sp.]|nr:(deoxy)nucleoside triphosphate pyrophosphohydrolase [Nitrospira sp.]
MNSLQVACAIIEYNGRVLAAQRSEFMSLPLKWEFPGGKIQGNESLEECLRRELIEEMGILIEVGRPLSPVSHEYSEFSVTLHPYICSIVSDQLTLHEHKAIVWLLPNELHIIDWAEADIPVVAAYMNIVNGLATI